MSRPRLLLLDEPSLGLAPLISADIFKTVATLTETGVAVLLVEQNVHAALALAKRAYVIEMGRIVLSRSDLLHDPRVRECYLGKVALGRLMPCVDNEAANLRSFPTSRPSMISH